MAASRLAEVTAALKGIADAVETATTLRESQWKVIRVVKEAREYALEVANLREDYDDKSNDIGSQLAKVKLEMQSVGSLGQGVLDSFEHFVEENKKFNDQVEQMTRPGGEKISQKDLQDLCNELRCINTMATEFRDAFDAFFTQLEQAQQSAQTLSVSLNDVANAADAGANEQRLAAIGLETIGVILLALAPFTSGAAAFVAVGLGAAAGAGGVKLVFNASELKDLAKKFRSEASKLETIAASLQRNAQQSRELRVDQELVSSIQVALEHYHEELKREKEMEELREEIRRLRMERQDQDRP